MKKTLNLKVIYSNRHETWNTMVITYWIKRAVSLEPFIITKSVLMFYL